MPLQFTSAKLVKYWTGSAWAESQDFSNIKMWNGSTWQHVGIRPYADVTDETQTVTVGTFSAKGSVLYGFNSAVSAGSIADGTFNFVSNAVILRLNWTNFNQLFFEITGVFANSGWTKVTIDGTDFLRTAATFTTTASSTLWTWSGAANVFGTTVGAVVPSVFTQ